MGTPTTYGSGTSDGGIVRLQSYDITDRHHKLVHNVSVQANGDAAELYQLRVGEIYAPSGNPLNVALVDNQADALDITEGTNSYLRFVTTNNQEKSQFGKPFVVFTTADPDGDITTPVNGMIAYDSTDNELQKYENGAWAAIGSGAGATTGTTNLSFQINDDATTADEDPYLILTGGDGAEKVSMIFRMDSSADTGYIFNQLFTVADTNADRSTTVTLGPMTQFNSTGDDADSILRFRGHKATQAVGTFITSSITLDSSADELIIAGPSAGQIRATTNLNAEGGLDVTGGNFTYIGTGGSWTIAVADSAMTQTGTGDVTFTGNVNAGLGLDVTGAVLSAAVGIINTAGEVKVSGGNVQIDDDIVLSFGTNDDWSLVYDEATSNALELTGAVSADTITGSAYTTVGSDGGVASGGSPGGVGGLISFTSGVGGASATGGSNSAGVGGALSLTGGVGGAGFASEFNGATGGAMFIVSGAGGVGATGQTSGAGGALTLNAGAAGAAGGGTQGVGGNVTINAGAGLTAGSISIGATNVSSVTISKTNSNVNVNGNLNANQGLDVSGGELSVAPGASNHFNFDGQNIDLDPAGSFYCTMTAGNAVTFQISDGLDNSFYVKDAAQDWLSIDTADSILDFGNTSDNPTYNFLGTGLTTFGGNVDVAGNMNVQGVFTTVSSETVLIADNHITLNDGYTTAVGQSGGIVINRLPTATNDTLTGGGFASTTTVETVGATTFNNDGYIIMVSGSDANDGFYEVATHTAGTLTIKSSPQSFLGNGWTADGTTNGTITHVGVSVIQANATTGDWEVWSGNDTTGITFAPLDSLTTLQEAYDNSSPATITTDATGDITFAGTGGNFVVSTVDIDFDPTGNFTLDMDASFTATTTIADSLDNSWRVKEGSNDWIAIDTSGNVLDFGNGSDNPAYNFLGSGEVGIAGTLDVVGNLDANAGVDVTGAALNISTGSSFSQTVGTFVYNVTGSNFTVDAAAITIDSNAANLLLTSTTSGAVRVRSIGAASLEASFGKGSEDASEVYLAKQFQNATVATTINVGEAVYFGFSNTDGVLKAIDDSAAEASVIGICMEAGGIAGGAWGQIAVTGIVKVAKIAAGQQWNGGDRIYVSNEAGKGTNVAPSAGNWQGLIGICVEDEDGSSGTSKLVKLISEGVVEIV